MKASRPTRLCRWGSTNIKLADSRYDRGTSGGQVTLSIGTDANEAYYSVVELRDAVEMVGNRHPEGRERLGRILGTRCDDYQRAIYYALAGRGASHMLADLEWLATILEARGSVAREYPVSAPISPYVSSEPDGPVGCFPPSFPLGSSWRSFRSG